MVETTDSPVAACLMTPICQNKTYCFNEFVRGVLAQDFPHERLFWLFVVQEQGLGNLEDRIAELKHRVGDRFAGIESVRYKIPLDDRYFDPRAEILTWKERAFCAAQLRAVGINAIQELLPEGPPILSLGCDVCFNEPGNITHMLAQEHALLSGVILARLRHFPLVLHYSPAQRSWAPWEDYPRDRIFTTDWTGMDILKIAPEVYREISLFDFKLEDYGVGEDGWFCLEAKNKLGIDTHVTPFVMPWHIHHSGQVLWAKNEEVPPLGLKTKCPACGWEVVQLMTYADLGGACHNCKTFGYLYPWWAQFETCDPPYTMRSGG